MVDRNILKLARYLGIGRSYVDAWGNPTAVNSRSIQSVINALGIGAVSSDEAAWSWDKLKEHCQMELSPPTLVVNAGSVSLPLHFNAPVVLPKELEWNIAFEDGRSESGNVSLTQNQVCSSSAFRNRIKIELNTKIESGYHKLSVTCGERTSNTLVISAPNEAHYEEQFSDGRRVWGVTLQLYSLSSKKSWGIGDFSDLRKVVDLAASVGAGFIGLNPLHALSLHNLANYSPYSPSSRTMLNPLYIAIDELPETQSCNEYQALLAEDGFLAQLTELNSSPLVSYDSVWRIKRRALKILHKHFLANKSKYAKPSKDFRDDQESICRFENYNRFCEEFGQELDDYARFEAAGARMRLKDPHCWGYPVWPDEVNKQVRTGSIDISPEEVDFFKWIQWIAHEQLSTVTNSCKDRGLPIGLYLDLALSADKSGYDVWKTPESYALDLDVGAPPDILNMKGQNWGFAPMKPAELLRSGFKEFRAVLQSAMKYAGAIRLDHVMALMRLFCIPKNCDPSEGAYLRFFLKELMGVVALESQRNNCVIIGEDLGTVPPAVQREMAKRKILSYKVIQFMAEWGGNFTASEHYPEVAMVTPGTHDTATLPGWWSGLDITTRQELDLLPEGHNLKDYESGRDQEKRGLMERLHKEGLREDNHDSYVAALANDMDINLIKQITNFAAKTKCKLIALPIEDILLVKDQVNVPGVTTEYPCWRQKLPISIDDPQFAENLNTINPFKGK